MLTQKIIIPVNYGSSSLTIFPIGDIHFGAKGHCSKTFAAITRKFLTTPNSWSIFSGDVTDDDRPSTRAMRKQMYSDRDEAYTQEDKMHMAWLDKEIIPKLKPFAKRCLGMLDGDHFRIYANGTTSVQYMCNVLKVPYLGERMAWVWITFTAGKQKCKFLIHVQHGQGSASTIGGDINSLIRQVAGFEGDLFLAGHTHKNIPAQIPILGPNAYGSIRERKRVFVRTGGFLRSYLDGREITYAERACYAPISLGCPTVEVILGRNDDNNRSLGVLDIKVTV